MAVLGPFNFPGHLPNGHIVPALLAGNTVVFKPSEMTPMVAQKTLECWQAANIPPGVINLVQGGKETGKALSEHKDINGLLFTGSWNTGCHFAKLFAEYPEKILALEMGGNNPYIISSVQNIQAAAYLTIQSAFLTSGQRCTCARRLIIIDSPQSKTFLSTLIKMAESIRVGAYTDSPEPFMGPLISAAAASMLISKHDSLIRQGAIPILPLKILSKGPAFLSPGIIDVSAITSPDEELFGPLLQVIHVPNFTAALEIANRTKYGLAAGLLSDKPKEYELFYKYVKAGIINWNTPLTGASSAAPFGGIGQSGNHRPSALYAADYCAYPIASLERGTIVTTTELLPGIEV
jgi:succinylglutamic semialdehyde dehydrogenase